jgi:hypothetical protein
LGSVVSGSCANGALNGQVWDPRGFLMVVWCCFDMFNRLYNI